MKKTNYLMLAALFFGAANVNAQKLFDNEIQIPAGYQPVEVVLPPSPLSLQVLFVGGTDLVQTTPTYGNPAGQQVAKEWHDFIGFTPDNTGQSLGWVTVNHEMIFSDDKLGDGGGMTVFRVKRAADGSLEIVDQTLADGRSGRFFNVDFANTVGETGMNCGGISSQVDGRIWTAEEWFRSNNASIASGVRDTTDFTVNSDIPGWNGVKLKKFQNFNWMVEIDPREAKAIRKQYNWGRQPFEGGVIEPSNRLVYLGPDDTPGFLGMFVSNTPGDFNKGTLFVYKHDKPGYNWVPIWEDGSMLEHKKFATQKGATMFNRIEWVTMDKLNNVYFTETGLDKPGNAWADENALGAVHDPYHVQRAQALGFTSPNDPNYPDYYGRIWKYDPVKDTCTVYLEGGPALSSSPSEADYPEVHLSNPDGLTIVNIGDKQYLLIQEDLNGSSFGRMPSGAPLIICEAFLLDLSIQNPTLNDLIRLTATPVGAEITGAIQTSDGKSILINSQHPNTNNPFPYNHSLTFAINGLDKVNPNDLKKPKAFDRVEMASEANADAFTVYPNPTARMVYMNQVTDVAIFDSNGKRVMVRRNTSEVDVSALTAGVYYIQNAQGSILKLVIQ
ncbi:MAG: DUF839 domain-containing protein [Saprospiraceae bacterium]|nr:DUF839 domain-containing protein [Saprospiraceae bacterium]